MSNTAELSYKWSEKGEQPLIKQKQHKRERHTLFGSVNPISGEVIVQKASTGNADTFKKYLRKILRFYRNSNRKNTPNFRQCKVSSRKKIKAFFRG